MQNLVHWLKLYRSRNPVVKIRAARGLLKRSDEVPLAILLNILDTLADDGLGAETEKALRRRRDPELVPEMIARLKSPNVFTREVACEILGEAGDARATPYLLRTLDDPDMLVRRAAAFALASLKDPASVPELKRVYAMRRDDDINVIFALETALSELGVEHNNLFGSAI
jgi:HEAT repeat protein